MTKSGTYWHPSEFFTLPGIRVLETGQFYVHAHSNPGTYGWRLVSPENVANMTGLRPVDIAPKLQKLWFSDTKHTMSSSNGHSSSNVPDESPDRRPVLMPGYEAATRTLRQLPAPATLAWEPMIAQGALLNAGLLKKPLALT